MNIETIRFPQIRFDISELNSEFKYVFGNNYEFHDEILPCFKIQISNLFVVVLFFSIDGQISFISVHGFNESDSDESKFKIYQNLSNYFSSVLRTFLTDFRNEGLSYFLKWVIGYDKVFFATCKKCGEIVSNDEGIVMPPIMKTINGNDFYHMKCFPKEK